MMFKKRCFSFILSLCLCCSVAAPVLAESKTDLSSMKTTEVVQRQSYRNYTFEALKADILKGRNAENIEVIDLGLREYSNGLKNQKILIVSSNLGDNQRAVSGTVTGRAVDHWFEGILSQGKAVADVTVIGNFSYTGGKATVDSSSSSHVLFDADFNYNRNSIKDTDGSPAKVDLSYSIYRKTLTDHETVTVKCDKNGKITAVGQNELIP